MGSFRASFGIIDVLPGVQPESVLETASAAVGTVRHVEDAFVDVDPIIRGDGVPRVVVRFLVPTANDEVEDARAWDAARTMADAVRTVATGVHLRVYRRSRGQWLPIDDPAEPEPDW